MDFILYLICGILVGGLGTLIGAGGGFILVPLLLFYFPDIEPSQLTAISLFAVACNTTSGTIGYAFKNKVHFKSAIIFALFGIPGALIGSHYSGLVNRSTFITIFSLLIFILGTYLLIKNKKNDQDLDQSQYKISSYNLILGVFISFLVGLLASFLGIGGGIIHVPLLTEVVGFPVHLAAGTSHFILAITTIAASIVHFYKGELDFNQVFVMPLAIGTFIGAQFGAWGSKFVKGQTILRILAVILIALGIRLFYQSIV